jgi:hypothetical protein
MARKRTTVRRELLLERIRQQVIVRTPGQAVTREQYLAMGYGIGGRQGRNFTDSPIGWEAHRKVDPEAPV